MKVIFHKVGPFNWKNAVRLCIEHPAHAGYFVNRLWSYFVPVPPDPKTASLLEALYVHSGHQVRPVVTAILRHPLLYEGPRMVKSPVVYTAGLLRMRGDRIETEDWIWLDAMAGQQLFYPPNVSGWDDTRWLDTSTFRARWLIARRALQKHSFSPDHATPGERPPADPAVLVNKALGWWNSLSVSPHTRAALLDYATKTMAATIADDEPPEELPDHGLQRAPPSRRGLAGDADRMTHHCKEFSRSSLLRQGIAEAGRGLPVDRDRHAASRRHGARPAHVPLAHARRRADGLRRLGARPEGVRRRDRAGLGSRQLAIACSSRCSRRAAGTRCPSSIRTATRTTAGFAPRSR